MLRVRLSEFAAEMQGNLCRKFFRLTGHPRGDRTEKQPPQVGRPTETEACVNRGTVKEISADAQPGEYRPACLIRSRIPGCGPTWWY